MPEQKLTLEEALRAYTVGSAVAEFQDKVKGTITPGKLADLVLLDRDLFALDPTRIDRAQSVMTVRNGQIVHGPA